MGRERERDVLRHRQDADQHEMLVHHADAVPDGVARRVELDLLAPQDDAPRVGAIHPVQDVHQGSLAGPVLPEEGVHLARRHLEVHAVVGDHPRERLGDALHPEERRARHAAHVPQSLRIFIFMRSFTSSAGICFFPDLMSATIASIFVLTSGGTRSP